MISTTLFTWVRAAKIFAVAFVCAASLFVSNAPAFAFGTKTPAAPAEGAAQLDDTYEAAKQTTKGQPRGMGEVQEKASSGLNGVQGTADASKMKSPGDSEGATTVKGQVKDALDSALDG